jgi:hypothetical protein
MRRPKEAMSEMRKSCSDNREPRTGRLTACCLLAAVAFTVPQASAAGDDNAPPPSEPFIIGAPTRGHVAADHTPFVHYGALLQMQVRLTLGQCRKLPHVPFRGLLRIRVTPSGGIAAVDVLRGTGDSTTDSIIQQAIAAMPALPEAPPPNMPLSVIVTVASGQHHV